MPGMRWNFGRSSAITWSVVSLRSPRGLSCMFSVPEFNPARTPPEPTELMIA